MRRNESSDLSSAETMTPDPKMSGESLDSPERAMQAQAVSLDDYVKRFPSKAQLAIAQALLKAREEGKAEEREKNARICEQMRPDCTEKSPEAQVHYALACQHCAGAIRHQPAYHQSEAEKIYNSLFISRDRPITAQTDIRMLELALVRAREEGKAEAMESEAVLGMREALLLWNNVTHLDPVQRERDFQTWEKVATDKVRAFDALKASLSENQTKGKGE